MKPFQLCFLLSVILILLVVFSGFCCSENLPAVPSGDGVGGQVCSFVLKALVSLVNSARRLGDAGFDCSCIWSLVDALPNWTIHSKLLHLPWLLVLLVGFSSARRVGFWFRSASEVHLHLTKATLFEKSLVPPLSLVAQPRSCL